MRALLFLLAAVVAGCSSSTTSDTQTTDTTTSAETPSANVGSKKKTILFFGNSLSAGYGLDSPTQAFPALVGQKIDSAGLPYRVINAGLSGETTAGGRARLGWVLRQPVDVFVLELGGNDGLRGIALADTRRNLAAMIDTVRARYPQTKVVLAGMQIPPNLGTTYTRDFKALYGALAQEKDVVLIPFLLEGVGGISRLNQPDGIHPTAEGHRYVANTVWKILEPVLRSSL